MRFLLFTVISRLDFLSKHRFIWQVCKKIQSECSGDIQMTFDVQAILGRNLTARLHSLPWQQIGNEARTVAVILGLVAVVIMSWTNEHRDRAKSPGQKTSAVQMEIERPSALPQQSNSM
jgi:hypothetical protein